MNISIKKYYEMEATDGVPNGYNLKKDIPEETPEQENLISDEEIESKIEYLCKLEWSKLSPLEIPYNFQYGFDKGYKAALQSAPINEVSNIDSDKSWDLRSVLNKLIEAATILLDKKNYDGHGWEEISHATNRATEIVNKIMPINEVKEKHKIPSAKWDENKKRIVEDKEQDVKPFDFNQLDTDIKRMFPVGNNIKKLIEDEANKQGIFEPKYGGKDHSGYDTLMKYEVNSYLEDYFEKGALWIVEKLTEKIKNLPQTYGEKGLGKVYDIAINDVLNLLK